MTKEIRAFLDDVFSYEDVVPMTRQECAANIQYWREGGIGQANRRTAGAEAACAFLQSKGYNCGMYYQMD